MNPLVREARHDDASAIARIHVIGWQAAYRGIVPDALLDGLSIPKRTAQWERWLGDTAQGKFVVETDGTVAGFASFGRCRDKEKQVDAHAGELYAIYIDPAQWRSGLGSLLLLRVELELAVRSFSDVTLWVLEANRPGRTFYEKHGYRTDGTRKNAFPDGAAIPEIRYAKAIATRSS